MAGIDKRGLDPRRDLDGFAVPDRAELWEHPLRVVRRVERGIQVDLEMRWLGAEIGFGIAWPAARGRRAHRFDNGRQVLGVGVRRRGRGLARAGGGQVDSRLVGVGFLEVVCRHLVRVAALPACLALGELLVETA